MKKAQRDGTTTGTLAARVGHLRPGVIVAGCEIIELMAEGGMGAVYRARQVLLDREVALKVMAPRLMRNERTVKSFLLEGKLMAKLDHPSIVRIYNTVEENGLYFLVMEFVEGRNLRDVVAEDGPLTVRKALRIVSQVAEALEVAHQHRILHLDIKPANILLAGEEQVKVTDFGISNIMRQGTQDARRGPVLGTPAYMSPEQCLGKRLTAASDIYSLGATLYTLLSGRVPFRGRTAVDIARKVIREAPPALEVVAPNLPERVVSLVQRMMAKDPKVRYQSGAEVVQAIERVLSGDLYPRRRRHFVSFRGLRKAVTGWHLAYAVLALWLGALLLWALSPRVWPSLPRPAPQAQAAADPEGAAPPREKPPTPALSLSHRAEAFLESLIRGQPGALVVFLPPSHRNNPVAREILAELYALVRAETLPEEGRVEILTSARSEAGVVFRFPGKEGREPFAFHLTWQRGEDGVWYISPDFQSFLGK